MRLTLVTETYFPQVNGVSRTLGQLVRRLTEAGDKVQLILPDYGRGAAAEDVTMHRVRSISPPFYRELRLPLPPFGGVHRAIDRFRPDLIHIATEAMLGLSTLGHALRRKIPVVSSFHTNFDQYSDHYGVGWARGTIWRYMRWFHNRTRETYVPSRPTIAGLRARGFERLILWPRGVDSRLFRPDRPGRLAVRRALGIGPDELVVGYVGRIAVEKNVTFLADSLARVAAERPDTRFLFVGDGPARSEVERQMGPHASIRGIPERRGSGRPLRHGRHLRILEPHRDVRQRRARGAGFGAARGCVARGGHWRHRATGRHRRLVRARCDDRAVRPCRHHTCRRLRVPPPDRRFSSRLCAQPVVGYDHGRAPRALPAGHRARLAPRGDRGPCLVTGPALTTSNARFTGMEPLAAHRDTRPCRGLAFWTALGVGLVVGLADVSKPVHIDDTLYLTIARWIVGHPLDPFGGTLNWQQFPERTYKVSISPPLLSYAFALVIAVAGENVPLLHLAMVPWVLLSAWALYRLGNRFADAGMATALLVLPGPAVLAGMNLMLDVPLMACICAAVECLLRGVERRSPRWYLGAALIGATGVLIKFPALALVPVFLVVAVRRRRWGPLLAAAGPVAALVGWQMVSRSLYGSAQVETGLSFLGQFRTSLVRELAERTLSMFAIIAWTLPIWLLAPSRLTRRGVIGAGLAAVLTTVVAAALVGPQWWQRPWPERGTAARVWDWARSVSWRACSPGCRLRGLQPRWTRTNRGPCSGPGSWVHWRSSSPSRPSWPCGAFCRSIRHWHSCFSLANRRGGGLGWQRSGSRRCWERPWRSPTFTGRRVIRRRCAGSLPIGARPGGRSFSWVIGDGSTTPSVQGSSPGMPAGAIRRPEQSSSFPRRPIASGSTRTPSDGSGVANASRSHLLCWG